MSQYYLREMSDVMIAIEEQLFSKRGDEGLGRYSERQLRLIDTVVNAYPKAVEEIEPEFGLHLDTGGYVKIAETDRFELYQVLPTDNEDKASGRW